MKDEKDVKIELENAKAYVDSFGSEGVPMETFCKQFNYKLIDKLKRVGHTFEPRRGQIYSIKKVEAQKQKTKKEETMQGEGKDLKDSVEECEV